MAFVGFEEVKVGIFDEAGESIEEVVTWRDDHGGTVNMTITGLEKETTQVHASNRRVWMSKRGVGDVTNTFEAFNPPPEDTDKVLGRDTDGQTSWAGEDTNPPHVAIIAKSSDVDGTPVYLALTYGLMGLNEISLATETQETTPPTNTTLTGSWQDREIEGKNRTFGKHIGSEGYEDFEALIFPGYTDPGAA